ncbi:MAG: glycosyltransferase family 2 protein [Lachnospiraceae bacterium]|nr:glycosyltransferase family 2 protein [Lachnospiraceae bacterium]
MVSIVIPVFNSERFINKCLDSLIGQEYRDIEIVCVNDGSSDHSLAILNEYTEKDSRIRVYSKENEGKGAAGARNLGLTKATGDYVMFLDSDDFFESDLISSLMAEAEKHDADLVCCGADRYDDRLGKVTGEYKHIELKDAPEKQPFSWRDCPERVFQIGDLIAWNKLYKRDLLTDNDLWFEPIPISDDQYIPALTMVLAERIVTIDRPLIHYRFNTGSSQVDSQPKHPEAAYSATFSIVKRLRELGIYEDVKRSYLNMAVRLMREYFDKMTTLETLRFLYDKYRDEVFPELGATGLTEDYFYDRKIGEWHALITNETLEEVLFRTSRAYGAAWTTAILRFKAPYEKIDRGSRIVLVGRGLVGRYWYAQLMLSGYCEVVAWVSDETDISNGLDYDSVIKAE